MNTQSYNGVSARYVAVIVLMLSTVAASALSESRKRDFLARPLESIDTSIGGWTATERSLPAEVLNELKPAGYLSRLYKTGGKQIGLFIAFYAEQRAGESMHSPKNCLPGSGWEVLQYGTLMVPLDSRRVRVNKYLVQNGSDRMLVLYWYQTKDRIIASEYLGKLFLIRDALVDGSTAGSLVRISLPDNPDALGDGVAFASRIIPQVQRCLRF